MLPHTFMFSWTKLLSCSPPKECNIYLIFLWNLKTCWRLSTGMIWAFCPMFCDRDKNACSSLQDRRPPQTCPDPLHLYLSIPSVIISHILFAHQFSHVFYFKFHCSRRANLKIWGLVFHFGKYFVLNPSLSKKFLQRCFLSFKWLLIFSIRLHLKYIQSSL